MTWLPWVALAALAAGVGVWEARRPVTAPENPLANARFTRFTDWEGTEGGAEISPDGRFVAFLADRDGRVRPLAQPGGHRAISQPHRGHPAARVPQRAHPATFGFSGDGAEIWFSPRATPAQPKMLMPLTGGTPRAFLGEGAASPGVVSRRHPPRLFQQRHGDPLFVADRTGADARPDRRRPTQSFSKAACTTTIRSGRRTASGSTSCTAWNRPRRWTSGAFGPRADRRSR